MIDIEKNIILQLFQINTAVIKEIPQIIEETISILFKLLLSYGFLK